MNTPKSTPEQKRIIPLINKVLDDENLSYTVHRRRCRWLGRKAEEYVIAGEVIAAGAMQTMWEHGKRLSHLYILWGGYRSVYLNQDEYATRSQIKTRMKNYQAVRTSEQTLDAFFAEGKAAGLWEQKKSGKTYSLIPSAAMVRSDTIAHIAGLGVRYIRCNPLEQGQIMELWTDEMGFQKQTMLDMQRIYRDHATRGNSPL
jgi:hypothetical protein